MKIKIILTTIVVLGIFISYFVVLNQNSETDKKVIVEETKHEVISTKDEYKDSSNEIKNNIPKKQELVNIKSFDKLIEDLEKYNYYDKDLINLAKNKLDVNTKNEYGISPLFNFFLNSNFFDRNILDLFLEIGADLRVISLELDLLNAALLNKNKEVRERLIDYLNSNGINFQLSSSPEKYILSINRDNINYLDEIIPYIDINYALNSDINLFEHSLNIGANNETISYFLEKNVVLESQGYNALHASIFNNNISIENIQKIIDKVYIDSQIPQEQKTALMIAIENNSFDKAKILIENGANLYIEDKDGNNSLMYIEKSSIKDEILKLLEKEK